MSARTLFEKIWDAHVVRAETADRRRRSFTSICISCTK